MKEHPILFSSEMVNAILEGRKTQTRRVVKAQTEANNYFNIKGIHAPIEKMRKYCPYGQVGDRLWVRETFKHYANKWDGNEWKSCVTYKADLKTIYDSWDKNEPPKEKWWNKSTILDHWQPSIFMPRWASRITLEITNIRAERLHDITIKHDEVAKEGWPFGFKDIDTAPVNLFIKLWDSINGKKHSWESNPFVWVIEFKRI